MVRVKCAQGVKKQWLHHYEIIGRAAPSECNKTPKVWKFQVFAPNRVVAKSRFHYYLNRQQKIKKARGTEILGLREIHDKHPLRVNNYAVALCARSKYSITNLTKEFRDVTAVGAVQQLYHEMAARHRARFYDVQVIKTSRRASLNDCKRPAVKQFMDSHIAFPLNRRIRKRLILKRDDFQPRAPSTFA